MQLLNWARLLHKCGVTQRLLKREESSWRREHGLCLLLQSESCLEFQSMEKECLKTNPCRQSKDL